MRNGFGRTSLQLQFELELELELEIERSPHMSIASALKRTMTTPPKESRKVVEGIFGA
jgi:hypothetical protein